MHLKNMPHSMFTAHEESAWAWREEAKQSKEEAERVKEQANATIKALLDEKFAAQQGWTRQFEKRKLGIPLGDDSPPPAEPAHSFEEEQSLLFQLSPSNLTSSSTFSPATSTSNSSPAAATSSSPRRKRKSEGGFRAAEEKCERFVKRVVEEEGYSGSSDVRRDWMDTFLTIPRSSRSLVAEEEAGREAVANPGGESEVTMNEENKEEVDQGKNSGRRGGIQAEVEGLRRSKRVKNLK